MSASILARQWDRAQWYWRGDHQRACRSSMQQKLVENGFKPNDVYGDYFHDEAVLAGDAMTLHHFGRASGQLSDPWERAWRWPDSHVGED